tara:strand:- start:11409 stop:11618 length:210 start_codon:yes stop_codon:yes gene_type:complete
MNALNVVGTALLAWLLVGEMPANQPKETKVYVPIIIEQDNEEEAVVEAESTTAEFPRPRKPCPSGPGKG